jgi:hypothetical protein
MSFTFKLARRTARLRVAVCGTLLLSALACDAEEVVSPSAEPEVAEVTSEAVAPGEAMLTSSSAPGIAFGDFHLPTSSFKYPYSGALLALWPTSATTKLNAAKNAGMRVVVGLAGNRRYYTNSDGTFSMSKWKSRINLYKGTDFGRFVSSGTLLAHYLTDEPFCARCWGGRKISASQIEEMARYSKSIWPSMPTAVRSPPTLLENRWYRYLDVSWAQWEGPHVPSYGLTPEQFRDKQIAAAKARGLGIVFGMNYINGGNGSSGILGTYDNARSVNRWAMSAAEVKKVGSVFAKASYACAVLSWQYSSTVLNWSGMKNAISYVGGIARNRARSSCKK